MSLQGILLTLMYTMYKDLFLYGRKQGYIMSIYMGKFIKCYSTTIVVLFS